MAPPAAKLEITTPEAFAAAFSVSRETIDRLATYEDLLRRWQRAVNLVAPSTLDSIWQRHFADSAQLLALAPETAERWVDLGSGGGFPGLVLAILLKERGHGHVTLIESDKRKAAFLAEVARKTGVAVEIVAERIEKSATRVKLGTVDVITARALAPLPRLLGLAAHLSSPTTTGLFLKGKDAEAEVLEARKEWAFEATLKPSMTEPEARIVVIRNLHAKTED